MNYYTLTTKDGREIKLRLDTPAQRNLVKELGAGIMTSFNNIFENPAGFISSLIWCSAQKFQHKFTKQDADELTDQLVDEGYALEEFTMLAVEILGVSGFFDQATVESFRKDMQID